MLRIFGVVCDQVWYKRPSFYNSNFSEPNGLASSFGRVFLEEEISAKIISIRDRVRICRERLSVPLSDFFLPLELDNNLSDQPVGPPRANLSIIVILTAAPPIPKYNRENLQQILKIILEARVSTTSMEP